MNIGQAAKASGISAKMIRYYEAIGLVPKAGRTDGGYRDYGPEPTSTVCASSVARAISASLSTQVRELLKLWSDQKRSSADVKALALRILRSSNAREQLQDMIATLKHLADACEGDHRPDCPIIDELESGHPRAGRPAKPKTRPAHPGAEPGRAVALCATINFAAGGRGRH